MATTYLNLIGKARFIKNLFQPDDAFGASKYKAGIWLDQDNLDKFYASGIQVTPKSDQDGTYVVLSRDDAKMIGKQLVYFTPPYIKNKDTSYRVQYVDENDEPIRQYHDVNRKDKIKRVGDTFLIGNGSLVELNVAVFDTKYKGKGHRLEGVRILDLIEYKPQIKEDNVVPFEVDDAPKGEILAEDVAPKKKKAKAF